MADADVTQELDAYRRGDQEALSRAFAAIYQQLRALARRELAGDDPVTLNPTGLVHELYLRLADNDALMIHNRPHFLALAGRAMRQIVIDAARTRLAKRRGGGLMRLTFDDNQITSRNDPAWILEVDEALTRIRSIDERMAAVFECRFFAGLSEEETAAALDTSVRTVQRDWQRSKIWMHQSLTEGT